MYQDDLLRRLLVKLLQPLSAEIDVENFITGLWSLRMAPWLGVSSRGSQRSCAAQVLAHQGKGSTCNERKEDQVNGSQEVAQGWKTLCTTLVQQIVKCWLRFPGSMWCPPVPVSSGAQLALG